MNKGHKINLLTQLVIGMAEIWRKAAETSVWTGADDGGTRGDPSLSV